MIVVWDTGFAYVTWNRMFFMMIGMQKGLRLPPSITKPQTFSFNPVRLVHGYFLSGLSFQQAPDLGLNHLSFQQAPAVGPNHFFIPCIAVLLIPGHGRSFLFLPVHIDESIPLLVPVQPAEQVRE